MNKKDSRKCDRDGGEVEREWGGEYEELIWLDVWKLGDGHGEKMAGVRGRGIIQGSGRQIGEVGIRMKRMLRRIGGGVMMT